MLIYNHQKEFLGISQDYLSSLGFADLSELRAESADFADMFVKVPGFVHNFKHVHWIDFITSSDSPDGTPVIIHANSKNFQCSLEIQTMYLTSDPYSPAYMISINNIMETTDDRIREASTNIIKKPLEVKTQPIAQPIPDSKPEPQFIPEIKEDPIELTVQETKPIIKTQTPSPKPVIDDVPIELNFDDTPIHAQKPTPITKKEVKTTPKVEVFDNGYIYEPQVASDELGLPLDLIEEFIEDFIAQAHEFKNEMYDALQSDDSDTLKILSHKLKGVAANLRIEDALDALTTINLSSDNNEIKNQLDLLYKIITKLSNKPIDVEVSKPISVNSENKTNDIDDEIDLDIFIQKDEPTSAPKTSTKKTVVSQETVSVVQEPEIKIDLAELEIETPQKEVETPQKTEEQIPEPAAKEKVPAEAITYDKQKIANEIGMTSEEFSLIFNDYIEESQDVVQQMLDALASSDLRTINRKAMQLKGMNDNMRVSDCKDDLEMLLTTQDTEAAKQLVEKIKAIMQQLSQMKG